MHYKSQSGLRKTTTFLQVVFLTIAIVNVLIVSNSVENKQGLSLINKILSWTISSNIIFKFIVLKKSFFNTSLINL